MKDTKKTKSKSVQKSTNFGKLNMVSAEEILEAGGTSAWAKKINYNFSLRKFIGVIKLTPKMEQSTTKMLLKD
ncbi:MAG: hypothetical protein EAZ85_03460 [Bacteroidetes bacterium]|nr:MAG: hypothetical protein EAZ85_03460 [Bacteroidota bacterium]